MAITREKKSAILKRLMEDWQKAKSVVFSTYQGVPVKEFSKLRKGIREKGARLEVTKKTLIRLAAKRLKYPEISEDSLPGPVSITFSFDDEVSAAKLIQKFGKDFPQVGILGAFMEGKLLSEKEAKFLAAIPEKDELLAKLVGSLKAPVSGFHGILYALLRNFVYAMSEVRKKKAASEAPKESPDASKS